MSEPAPLLLVHGAWGNAGSWGALPAQLRTRGFRVNAIDLPGHGADPTPPEGVTLHDYGLRIVDALQGRDPAIVVGHSMGGMAISAAAELAPERFRALIYLCAFLPRDGDSLIALKSREEATIGAAVRAAEIPGTTRLDADVALPFLCQDADEDAQARVRTNLGLQPNAPQTDTVRLSANRFGGVPRVYIRCTKDRTITPELQQAMAQETPCEHILTLPSGHLPQISVPGLLAEMLAGIMRQYPAR